MTGFVVVLPALTLYHISRCIERGVGRPPTETTVEDWIREQFIR